MHYKYVSSQFCQKLTCNSFPNNEMDRCKISKWAVVLGTPDRVNIPCLMHGICLCQIYVKMTYN